MIKNTITLVLLLLLTNIVFGQVRMIELDTGNLFKKLKVNGCFVLYDIENNTYQIANPSRAKLSFIPASTFKIFNALTALETGVIDGADHQIKWDGIDRGSKAWNKDHTLESAFQASAIWYFQELARQIGDTAMQHWLDVTNYGNHNMQGGIDRFWLMGDLRISAIQQVEFLALLVQKKLPFDEFSQKTVLNLMVQERKNDFVMGAKSGWGFMESGASIGWYVGYLRHGNKWYTFATNMETNKPENGFVKGRREITLQLLETLKLYTPSQTMN